MNRSFATLYRLLASRAPCCAPLAQADEESHVVGVRRFDVNNFPLPNALTQRGTTPVPTA